MGNALLRMGDVRESAESYKAYLDQGGESEASERVRRILQQIAPDLVPVANDPLAPDRRPPPPTDPDDEDATG